MSDRHREARERLVARNVETSHLSVESIIETYADRIAHAYPQNRDDIIEERDDLLAWYLVSPAGPEEPREGLPFDRGAVREALHGAFHTGHHMQDCPQADRIDVWLGRFLGSLSVRYGRTPEYRAATPDAGAEETPWVEDGVPNYAEWRARSDTGAEERLRAALDEAWNQAEAVLPEDWELELSVGGHGRRDLYFAKARYCYSLRHYRENIGPARFTPYEMVHADNPVAALRALRAILSGGSVDEERDSDE